MELIQDLMRDWYLTLSQFSAALSVPLSNVTSQTGLPFLGALLKRSQQRIGQVSGAIFILAGINDTLTYWFI
jgi:hypothetical protein